MGLCKCPKKKVTNQFCFEHRVNVCEHCIVSDHTKCVVQSYLQWLNDSEYVPKCTLCQDPLDKQECTRLVCYDVFHSSCFDNWGSSHPPHTAPAGFKCPTCKAGVFPAPQLASPVALALKQTLTTWSWARRAMGVTATISPGDDWDTLSGTATSNGSVSSASSLAGVSTSTINNSDPAVHYGSTNTSTPAIHTPTTSSSSMAAPPQKQQQHQQQVQQQQQMQSQVQGNATSQISPTYRKHSSSESHSVTLPDEGDTDDNKYKRRPALVWFKRWWRSYQPLGGSSRAGGGRRRMLALLLLIAAATVLLLLIRGRAGVSSDSDPMLDPLNNPNIHVQDSI